MPNSRRPSLAPRETRKVSIEEVRKLQDAARGELGDLERVSKDLEELRMVIHHTEAQKKNLEFRLAKCSASLHEKYRELAEVIGQRKAMRVEVSRLREDIALAFDRIEFLLRGPDPFQSSKTLPKPPALKGTK